ncbi:MAG: divalent-cation tolerance protein CutA [Alphaproteobacteria bacterium]|nr:MAG: divalent-cation tolerance protein CutA [Alphaproteobacteria bacterium]
MSEDKEFVTIYVMAENEDVAVHMATALVKERLVACANVNTGTRSIYEWDGIIQLDNEVTIFMKTTADKVSAAVERLKALHSYEVPCITVLPIVGGNEMYLDWVAKQVGQEAHPSYED